MVFRDLKKIIQTISAYNLLTQENQPEWGLRLVFSFLGYRGINMSVLDRKLLYLLLRFFIEMFRTVKNNACE